MINEVINLVVAAILLVSITLCIWNKLDDKKINYFKFSNILKFIICCILLIINYKYNGNRLKPLVSTIIIMLYFLWLYKKNFKKSIILPIYSQIVVLLAELVYAGIILVLFPVNDKEFTNIFFGTIISNFCIAIIVLLIIRLKIITNIYNKILKITDKIKNYRLFFLSMLLIAIFTLLIAIVYYKVNVLTLLLINTSVIVIYTVFIFLYIRTNNNYAKVYDKYNVTLNSLKEYEDILSRYRISNHENKNQLLTIRAMVNNKKVSSYIDEIIENKIKDNEKLMVESLIIPEGGLRGLIYSKMLLMKENNIEHELDIDKKIKTTTLTELSEDLVLNICSIVGVYLDNAIEAVKDLDEKYIIIEMYLDDTLNIAITNNYDNTIDINRIDDIGYSTKGDNHGYGLSLVKEIIDNNKNITNVKRISEDEFTQEIRINIKKKM